MAVSLRKSKMVSFRLSPADYIRFREICASRGVHSISDLARIAMESFAASEYQPDPLTNDIRDLQGQLRSVTIELERIAKIVDSRKAAGV